MTVTRVEIERGLDDVTRPFLALLTTLHASLGGVTEIRIMRESATAAGKKEVWAARIAPADVDALVDGLRPTGDAPRVAIPRGDHPRSGEANVYFSLGAVRPDPAWPTGPSIRPAKHTASNKDIIAYPWVVVDVDPEREPKDRSATDEEKSAALAVAEAVRAELAGRGVLTALANSGNGYHLLARQSWTDDSVVKDSSNAMKALLLRLHGKFSTPSAKVDIGTHNPGRIMKLYGTVATKGPDAAEAPHRLSSVDVATLPAPMDVFAAVQEPDPPPKVPKGRSTNAGNARSAGPDRTRTEAFTAWRSAALAALDLDAVYGGWLTGKANGNGWLECRDPESPSGDRNPSAQVADGTGTDERGRFHSFRTSSGMSAFDFVEARGRAVGFDAACRLIGELSGVPYPSPRPRAPGDGGGDSGEPADPLADLVERWAAGTDNAARSRIFDAAILAAVALSSVEEEAAIEEIIAATGMSRSAVQRAANAARRARRQAQGRAQREERTQARPEPPRPNIVIVDYVQNSDAIETLFNKLLAIIVPTERFFQQGKDLVYVQKGRPPVVLNDHNLPGILSSYLELALLKATDAGNEFERYTVLSLELARAFLVAPSVGHRLPVLTSYVRSPVFDREWRFIARFGYHPESGIFYDGPPVVPRGGSTAIAAAVNDFRWKADADRVNFVGAMLTGLTMPHWSLGHPFLAINGNKPGVGKSTLANVLAIVTEGALPSAITLTANDEEFEKQIATRVEAGDRVVVVDNAKSRGPISSAVLERSITAPRLNFRRLGSNTSISRPENDVLFVLTMNVTQLGADLRRRALPLNLEVTGNVRNVPYAAKRLERDVLAARLDILAELAGMVESWLAAEKPMPVTPARHSTDQCWAETIDGVLQHAGFEGFLSNLSESEHAFDEDYDALRDVCAAHHGDGFHTSAEWAAVLVDGALRERLRDPRGNALSPKSQSTRVGQLFSPYLDEAFTVDDGVFVLREHVPRKGHPSIYGFVPQE